MTLPELYVFAISHFCEKARWGLDAVGRAYTLRHLAPGAHREVAQQLGAAGSSLPFLVTDGGVVQGSGAILDWADAATDDASKRLAPEAAEADACRALEERLDAVVGVHVRRFYYSEAIVDHPETVRPFFTRDLEPAARRLTEENWPIVCRLMIGAMDLGPEQRVDSRDLVEGELDWLDGLLADGRRYLVGDRFSRADLTAAALLAPLAMPPEHPAYEGMTLPPLARADFERWSGRPTVAYVARMYRDHRAAG